MLENGETPERTALREIAEETGLEAGSLRVVASLPDIEYVFRWAGRLVFKRVHNFLVESRGGGELRPQLSEIEEVRWFSAEEARRRLSFRNSLPILEAAVAAVDSFRVTS
jgi:8-oxo-dGTP pyrophosphatase MutT (NUDIX family)